MQIVLEEEPGRREVQVTIRCGRADGQVQKLLDQSYAQECRNGL